METNIARSIFQKFQKRAFFRQNPSFCVLNFYQLISKKLYKLYKQNSTKLCKLYKLQELYAI